MSDPHARAVGAARRALGMEGAAGDEAHLVVRTDIGGSYWLLRLDSADRHVVAIVDESSGEVQQWAETHGGTLLPIGQVAATAAAGRPGAAARLVWRPTRASLSPLLPLWEVAGDGSERWVDQSGTVWDELPLAGPG